MDFCRAVHSLQLLMLEYRGRMHLATAWPIITAVLLCWSDILAEQALHGAMRLFQHRRIWFILTELNQPVIGRDGAIRYLQ